VWDWVGLSVIPVLVGEGIWFGLKRAGYLGSPAIIEQYRRSAVERLSRIRSLFDTCGPGLDVHVQSSLKTLCPKSTVKWNHHAPGADDSEAWLMGLVRLKSRRLGIALRDREKWRFDGRRRKLEFAEAMEDEDLWVPVYYDQDRGVIVDSTIVSEAPSEEMLALSPRTSTEWIAIHMEYCFGKKWRSSAVKVQS